MTLPELFLSAQAPGTCWRLYHQFFPPAVLRLNSAGDKRHVCLRWLASLSRAWILPL